MARCPFNFCTQSFLGRLFVELLLIFFLRLSESIIATVCSVYDRFAIDLNTQSGILLDKNLDYFNSILE